MLVFFHHLVNLLFTAASLVPASLGSTWIGLFFPVWVFFVAEVVSVIFNGWQTLKAWGKNVLIGLTTAFAAWGVLFVCCLTSAVYKDHTYFVDKVAGFKNQIDVTHKQDEKSLSATQQSAKDQLTKLQTDCAKTEGRAETLDKQTRDQQGTINNCQSQALKLLTQEPLVITKLPIYPNMEHQGPGIHKVHVLLLTNKTIPTVRLKVSCNRAITSAHGELVGGNMLSSGVSINPENVAYIAIDSPSWTPTRPLLIDVTYSAPKDDLACNVEQN